MEYNQPVIIDPNDTRIVPRKFDQKEIYAPCTSVSEKWQQSCYYELTQYWVQSTPYKGDYNKIGLLCDGISPKNNEKNKEACFFGIGNAASADMRFDSEKTLETCGKMPNKQAGIICQAGAYWAFYSNNPSRTLAVKMCNRNSQTETAECLKRGDLVYSSRQ